MLKLFLDCGVLCVIMQMLQGDSADDWAHLLLLQGVLKTKKWKF